ncbi:hypothetical protein BGZ65_004385 [Modicella reniformis]|uniref:Uncharacterized protein n=1 Tax=Modicella reniformis TaxID=1440133 RepID=A0A9P6IQ83_9FUNG|nr:hypothetical protein BGZ65_004385 [Modicella reniformis]
MRKEMLQASSDSLHAHQQYQQQQQYQCLEREEKNSSTSITTTAFKPFLITIAVKDDSGLLVDALNRLLLDTEGPLDEVGHGSEPTELRHHRQVYEYLSDLNLLKYKTQIQEDRVRWQEKMQ